MNYIFELPSVRKAVKMWRVRPSQGFSGGGEEVIVAPFVLCFGVFWLSHLAREILVPQLGIEHRPDRDWEACGRPFPTGSNHPREVL